MFYTSEYQGVSSKGEKAVNATSRYQGVSTIMQNARDTALLANQTLGQAVTAMNGLTTAGLQAETAALNQTMQQLGQNLTTSSSMPAGL